MSRRSRAAAAAAGVLWLAVPALLDGQPPPVELALESVASGLDRPVGAVHAGDGSGRLFVVEQSGAIRILRGGAILPETFLDLSRSISCCGERGLVGLAFHPQYPNDPRFFVQLTDPAGDSRLVELRVSAADPDRADPTSARTLLTVAQPFANHNGGAIAFGPDGLLYVGLGDGGPAGDPSDHAQNPASLLGKILRLDVDRSDPGLAYAIPAGNAIFPGVPGARGEIWALGLRNPWRLAFDRATGDLVIGDVGQNRFEEIDLLPPGSGGANLGWRLKEASACFEPPIGCDLPGLVDPILEYSHAEGCSVTGGHRYRGAGIPALAGVYLYGDFCSGRILGATPAAGGRWAAAQLLASGFAISSFGEDEAGELYVAEYAPAPQGRLHRLTASGAEP
ncbi:MAG TPA: PQQ-dependent sugar dehydrogenase, partial [Thermoanaerobaculia bacterium]|nr:PQQ-dependent sugar dehydrogenase [Thermoanaerobaculia bacterium]